MSTQSASQGFNPLNQHSHHAPPPSHSTESTPSIDKVPADNWLENLYEKLFGVAVQNPIPDHMGIFCIVYHLIRQHPRLRGTVRAAIQSAECGLSDEKSPPFGGRADQ